MANFDEIVSGEYQPAFRNGAFHYTLHQFSRLDTKTIVARFSLLDTSYELSVFPFGRTLCGFVAFILRNNDAPQTKVQLDFAVIDKGNKVLKEGPSFHLLDASKGLLDNDTLRIRMAISVPVDQPPAAAARFPELRLLQRVGRDLSHLLDSAEHSDIKLVVEGQKLRAHRAILMARSPVFRAMFSHQMSESKEGVVRLDDIPLPTFRQLLKFIYTGSCDLGTIAQEPSASLEASERGTGSSSSGKDSKDSAPAVWSHTQAESAFTESVARLLSVADRFELQDLVQVCADKLSQHVNKQNAPTLLALADAHSLNSLKAKIKEFERERLEKLSKTSEDFARLSTKQVHAIMTALSPDKQPEQKSLDHESWQPKPRFRSRDRSLSRSPPRRRRSPSPRRRPSRTPPRDARRSPSPIRRSSRSRERESDRDRDKDRGRRDRHRGDRR